MEVIFSLDQIGAVAERIRSLSTGFKIFAVHGDMGAGKTTLVHALCATMGVQGHISSPTFSIINQYTTLTGKIIYHMDLYRLKDETEAISSGVEDCLFSGHTCMVEWPENALRIFPEDTLHVFITAVDTLTRKLVIDKL